MRGGVVIGVGGIVAVARSADRNYFLQVGREARHIPSEGVPHITPLSDVSYTDIRQ